MRTGRLIHLGRAPLSLETSSSARKAQQPSECGCYPNVYLTQDVASAEPAVGDAWYHCQTHDQLLRSVLLRFAAGLGWERRAIWQEQDGHGLRGYVPPGGPYDVTVLSNSSPLAIERMWRVANGLTPLPVEAMHTSMQED